MSLLTNFYEQCFLAPKQTAFVEGEVSINYHQFYTQVCGLAGFFQQKSEKSQPIAVFLERGIDSVTVIYAILASGNCYLPLDISSPIKRLNTIIEDAEPHFMIGRGERPKGLSVKCDWLNLSQIKHCSFFPKKVKIYDQSIAAILYTSGSTGFPKGIALSHHAMINFVNWSVKTFHLMGKDKVASLTPFHFDLSIFDLFATLATGACVHFIPNALTMMPSRLTAWLRRQQITTFYTVPSLLMFITLKGNLAEMSLPVLRQVLFAGEVFPTATLIKLAQLLPHVRLYNLFGPTETNVCCYWEVDRERLDAKKNIPIGQSAANAQLFVTEEGQLWVKSDNNFSGYWQQGRLQARELNQAYATGDKVSYNTVGEYCYHGRLDRMLKCSGYRIEPAEIETVIQQIDGVVQCVVMGVKTANNAQRLAAVFQLHPQTELGGILKIIKRELPTYMWPIKFKILKNLPRLSNGKIDYLALEKLWVT
ncbi:MAG: AMP-binding protein [Methylococcales bacterium]|nr:AMP-binding protein [Methylococcales bacterium]